ncbi:TPA: hypothetical protein DDW35_12010, partial [Candidatus Sumerlaeota bacterium]|nr:hypothetical protein [Candidatus Sumerlaeota bacterium]
ALVSIYMFDITPSEYFHQTAASMGLTSIWIGVAKSVVFGVLVAVAGCLRGIQCGRSSAAVGAATTSAVVTGIVSIIVADSIITIIVSVLNI